MSKSDRKSASKSSKKERGNKVVRDSFSMPAEEYATITKVQDICLRRRIVTSKSEVIRAGFNLLRTLSDKEIVELIQSLTKVKTGRPPME